MLAWSSYGNHQRFSTWINHSNYGMIFIHLDEKLFFLFFFFCEIISECHEIRYDSRQELKIGQILELFFFFLSLRFNLFKNLIISKMNETSHKRKMKHFTIEVTRIFLDNKSGWNEDEEKKIKFFLIRCFCMCVRQIINYYVL